MNTADTPLLRPVWASLLLGAVLASVSAVAANKTASADALANYQRQREVCLGGQSNQDRATCLREAGAALAQAKQGGMGDDAATYSDNAKKRCESLPNADRTDCLTRMSGKGTTSGSAAGGGIYRELVTREPGAPSSIQPSNEVQAAPMK